MDIRALCDEMRQIAYEIHCSWGYGYLEKVYENPVTHKLKGIGRMVQQYSLTVCKSDGKAVGNFSVSAPISFK